jgi:hypothetical protein
MQSCLWYVYFSWGNLTQLGIVRDVGYEKGWDLRRGENLAT